MLKLYGSPECPFCQKTADQVRKLIAGPAVFICDECVDVCNQIIADDERMSERWKAEAEGLVGFIMLKNPRWTHSAA